MPRRAIRLSLKGSSLAAGWLLLSHGGMAAVVWWAAVPHWTQWALSVVLGCTLVWYWRREVWRGAAGSIVRLEEQGAHWQLVCRDGRQLPAELLPLPLVTPQLLVLRFRALKGRRRLSVTLWPDAADADELRRLRVRLRFPPAATE